MKTTNAKQYPTSDNGVPICKRKHPTLSLHRGSDSLPSTVTYIPEVRSGIRQQLKLLRSVSKSIILLGIACEFLLCLCMIPIKETIGTFFGFVCCMCGLLIALMSLFHAFCIRSAVWEITDELKKLSEEM